MRAAPEAGGGMRVARILSLAGVASRRKAEELIRQGRVVVNGHRITTPATAADPRRDRIVCDGRPVEIGSARHYVLLNKPPGYVCTRSDEKGRPTVLELLPPGLRHLYPVGRLDIDSEGLLLLTDDGDFCLRLTHPRYGKVKRYHVRVRAVPTPETLDRLVRGVRVEGELLRVRTVRVEGHGRNAVLDVTLTEGKRNELRRLLLAVGHPVAGLRRVAIEFLTLSGVPPGQHRMLSPGEAHRLSEAPHAETHH